MRPPRECVRRAGGGVRLALIPTFWFYSKRTAARRFAYFSGINGEEECAMAKKSSAKTAKRRTKTPGPAKSRQRASAPKAAKPAKSASAAKAPGAIGGRAAVTAGKYQQSGAPWWKQFLPS